MICKLAYFIFLNVLIFFLLTAHSSFCGAYNFLYKFLFVLFKMLCLVNLSFKPVCFKDQAGPPTQIMFFKCSVTTEKERPLSIHLRP